MNEVRRQTAKGFFRADYILVAATVCVCALAALLLFALRTESNVHQQTLDSIRQARHVRDAAVSLNEAMENAESARRVALFGDRSQDATYARAKQQAQAELAALDMVAPMSDAIAAATARVRRMADEYFAELDTVTLAHVRDRRIDPIAVRRAALVQSVNALRERLGAHTDIFRNRENDLRRYIDGIAALLAVVAFLSPALAILAVRRERRLWREANAIAEEARDLASASELAKSRFLAAASHDMRQPLHALSLYISALQRRVATDEARDILTKMDRATQSLVGMFSKLLDLARVQSVAAPVEIAPVHLQDVIDRVIAENPERAVDTTLTEAVVSTDPVLLERLLGNLVANALKHGGGHARIEVKERHDSVDLKVIDNGPGIAVADQERVFDEFVRLGTSGEGLGLGLSIVKRIAELLDVELKLDSAPGKGTRFSVRLPRERGGARATETAPSAENLVGLAVLVIDDDDLAREAMSNLMRDFGAEVRAGARGADADAILADGFAPRLILMDLRIDNEIAGVDLARRLRDGFAPPPPVIIVTGDTGPETLATLQGSGFAWLIKPVDPTELRDAVLDLLSSTSA